MCVYGYPGTVPVTMDQCIVHSEAVRRGAPNTFVIGDMPFLSYQVSAADAIINAGRFMKEASVDAVKLEGGTRVAGRIRALVDAGILVCGHIGLTPQSSGQLGGHKPQGRTVESARMVIEDALAVQEAGAQLILLEAIPPEGSRIYRKKLSIPVYSIGAGPECDGQLLIIADLIGQFQGLLAQVRQKIRRRGLRGHQCHESLRERRPGRGLPRRRHCYHMIEGEKEKFDALIKEYE
jgi:3-methyl-2-oxobutanoate hydroxymethyltransferase